jgi:hypothetical protein
LLDEVEWNVVNKTTATEGEQALRKKKIQIRAFSASLLRSRGLGGSG